MIFLYDLFLYIHTHTHSPSLSLSKISDILFIEFNLYKFNNISILFFVAGESMFDLLLRLHQCE